MAMRDRLLPALLLAAVALPAGAQDLLIRAGHVLDVDTGRMLAGRDILVRDGRVASVAASADAVDPGLRVLDWSALTVVPGLMDMHTHLADEGPYGDPATPLRSNAARDAFIGARNARATLQAGFTTVRDVGVYRGFADVQLRDAINAGLVPGPRMFVAGTYVTVTGGGGEITGLPAGTEVPAIFRRGVADNEAEVRRRVNEILDAGADFIKLIATGAVLADGTEPGQSEYTEAEIRAAVEEAGRRGRLVAAHAHGAEGIKRAVRAAARPATLRMAADLGVEVEQVPLAHWADLAGDGSGPALVVSTLPTGAGSAAAQVLAGRRLRGTLLDVVYADWPTPLARAGASAGLEVVSGLDMLVHQAAEQVRLMTGRDAPLEAMFAAAHEAVA